MGLGAGVVVAPGGGNFTVTACAPAVHAAELQAVIDTEATVLSLKVVVNVVAPGGAGAGTPFTAQAVVV